VAKPAKPAAAQLQPVELVGAELAGEDFDGALNALIAEGNQHVIAHVAGRLGVAEVAKSITQTLPKRPVSPAYRIHLMLVACAMATLPVLYLAFVAAAGWGVFYYIVHMMPSLLAHTPRGRAGGAYFLAISAPAIAGLILVLFLVKPLFFRIRDERRRRSLTRQSQPLLFELVDRICDATGAPKPQRIDVDYQVNASAQPLGGIWSVATGKMVLTIGIPLIAGLSSRQLAGVLAHEFGHFSQKIGMGASLVIRKVNFWFMRVVYQRDTLDHMLESSIAQSDWRFGIILQLANVCVMFSRGVLWCFMMLGHGISAGLMRQMEFDADRYEYGLVGSRTFAETSLELQLLGASQAAALQAMLSFFQKGRLADDMITLGNHFREQLPLDVQREIEKAQANEAGSWLATHPTDRARIARAREAAEDGVFHLERPARELVRHYEEICKGVTWDFYRDQLGSHVTPQQLTPTSQLLQAQA
jgi:Zn-dependent protease with chaperone function